VLRRHCDEVGRDYAEIERSSTTSLLLARDAAGLAAKRERLQADRFQGFAGTVSEAKDLIGQYRDVGVQLFISSAWRNEKSLRSIMARCGTSARCHSDSGLSREMRLDVEFFILRKGRLTLQYSDRAKALLLAQEESSQAAIWSAMLACSARRSC
jgi:hypothetical protein